MLLGKTGGFPGTLDCPFVDTLQFQIILNFFTEVFIVIVAGKIEGKSEERMGKIDGG